MYSTTEKIRRIVAETLGMEEKDVNNDTNLKTGLKVDSLDLMVVVSRIEKEFNIAIPDDQITRFETVKGASDYISNTRVLIPA